MQPWKIRQEGKMLKALKNFKGNAPVMAKLTKLIGCMKVCKNPSALGERKHGVHRGCYGAHLTKSVSLVYSGRLRVSHGLDFGHRRSQAPIRARQPLLTVRVGSFWRRCGDPRAPLPAHFAAVSAIAGPSGLVAPPAARSAARPPLRIFLQPRARRTPCLPRRRGPRRACPGARASRAARPLPPCRRRSCCAASTWRAS